MQKTRVHFQANLALKKEKKKDFQTGNKKEGGFGATGIGRKIQYDTH